MSNSKSVELQKFKARQMSQMRLVTRNGKQYFRVAHNKMTKHSNTEDQLRNRLTFANCINLWKCMAPGVRPYYAEKNEGKRNYNTFMRLNLKLSQTYLTREVLDAGGCIAHELVLSSGTLAPITLTAEGNYYRSNIMVGDLAITPFTPRNEISQAIVANNDDFQMGDTIALYLMTEYEKNLDGLSVPMIEMNRVELKLDPAAIDGQWDSLFMTKEGERCLFFACDSFGRCLVHWRQEEDELKASPASLCFGSRTDRYYDTLTEEAFQRAAESYGGLSE